MDIMISDQPPVTDWYAQGHADGVMAERLRIAIGHAELDACWKPLGVRGRAERIAARMEEMAARATSSWPGTQNMTSLERITAYQSLMDPWDLAN